MNDLNERERLRRWRLILGNEAEMLGIGLEGQDAGMDRILRLLYVSGGKESSRTNASRGAGLGASDPNVARWLGDIRTYFPKSIVQVMQKDAIQRLGLKQLLLEPEVLETMEPDIHLVTTLIALNRVVPEKTRSTARQVVKKVTDDLEKRLRRRTEQAVLGSLNRAQRNNRVEFFFGGDTLCNDRKLECAGCVINRDVFIFDTVTAQGIERAVFQTFHHKTVPAADDQGVVAVVCYKITFDDFNVTHSFILVINPGCC